MNSKDKPYKYPESALNTSNATWFVRLDDNKSHKKNKTGPCRRWGHSSEVLDNKLIVYGGTGYTTNPRHWESVYQLDLENWDWTKLDPANKAPSSRDSHSCVIYQRKLYIFGGSSGSDSRNDMLEYDLATGLWKKLDVRGNVPSPREGHSACLFDDRYIVIYGGWDGEETFKDCYLFDIPQRNWVSITQKIGTEPLPRESQSCCMLRNAMYLFGGQGNNIQKEGENLDNFCNDLHRLQITFEGNQVIATWDKLDIPGPKPSKRSSHASCAYQDKYMFIIGGEGYPPGYDEENKAKEYRKPQLNSGDGEKEYPCYPKNDVWYFDLDLNHWFPIKVKNEHEFTARFAHSCHNFKDYIVVFGGLQDYHSSTNDICVLSLDKTNPFNVKPSRGRSNVGSASQYDNESDDSMEVPNRTPKGIIPALFNETEKLDTKAVIEQEEKLERQATLTSQTSAMKQEALETLEEIEKLKNADTYYNEDEKVTEETSLARANTRPKRVVAEKFKAITPTHHAHHAPHTESAPVQEPVRENISVPLKDAPLVSLSFLNALSGIMSWPLAAFGLLLDNALISQASVLRINYVSRVKRDMTKRRSNMREPVEENKADGADGSNRQVYLQIEDDGVGWKHEDFLRVIMNYDTDRAEEAKNGDQGQGEMQVEPPQKVNGVEEMSRRLNEYSFNLKIAGFRLGKSMLYVSRNEDEISLGFLSADKRFNPNVHKNHVFYYSWKRSTGAFVSSHALKHKNIIFNALKGIISEDEIIKGIEKVSNRIIVLDLNPVYTMKSNGEKGRDYELMLKKKEQPEARSDIVVRTLDTDLRDFYAGPSVPLIELSLRTYFKHFFLDTSKIGLQVYLEDAPVEFLNVKGSSEKKAETERLIRFKEEGLFEGVMVRDVNNNPEGSDENKAKTKEVKNGEINQGVLVYFKNRLIRRLENPKLGNLDFLSSQHKVLHSNDHKNAVFDINGYVELRGYFKPNVFKTEIENPYYSNYLFSRVMPSLYELRNSTGKRRTEIPEEGDNLVKKVKTAEELK